MSIKTVIKRNGEVEQFNINKILNWELWACNGIKEHINWKDIIIKVKSQLEDGMSTQDIQLRLIDECNSRTTWLHSLVSGRLYASYISKKIFPENRPTIKELHSKLFNLGIMCKLNYTDEEYEILENVIDHYKDFNMSYAQVNQVVNKYAISERTTRTRHETPQFVFMRMAMALSEDETENKIEKTSKFYKYLSEFKINAPTPNYINLGTDHNGYISCCLYTTNDTAESLAVGDHIAYTMTYMSAGIGGYLMTRSRNDKVKNGKIVHMGKLPYFKSAAAAVNANMQGCYDDKTEILTEKGFILFKDLNKDTKVAQVHSGGVVDFVIPDKIMEYDYNGIMYHFRSGRNIGIDICVTPNHRMAWRESKHISSETRAVYYEDKGWQSEMQIRYFNSPDYTITEAETFIPSRSTIIDFGGQSNGSNDELTFKDRLNIAYQADGYSKCGSNYKYTFRFKKQRKIERLKYILDNLNIKYEVISYSDGVTNINAFIGYEMYKDFSKYNLSNKSHNWAREFIREAALWDGTLSVDSSMDAISYSSTNSENTKFIQALSSICSAYSHETIQVHDDKSDLYSVYVSFNRPSQSGRNIYKTVTNYNGKVYCVSVPTGVIITRRNGLTSVCGNSRGGAGTYYFMCFDPEVLDIIFLQNPRTPISKQNRDLHFAMQYNTLFVEKAYNNENIFTFNVHTAPDLVEAFFSGDPSKFKTCYEKYEKDDSFKKNYINARELAITAYKQSHEVATLYHINIDEVNRHTPFKEPIYQSNLCVAGETMILTRTKGYVQISELKDKTIEIWNGEQWSQVTVRKTSDNSPLLRVYLEGSNPITATPYHKWHILNVDGSVSIKETKDLQSMDVLIPFDLSPVLHGTKELSEEELINLFNIPSNEYSIKSRLNWLRVLIDSKGYIWNKRNPSGKVFERWMVITGIDNEVGVRNMLQELGIFSYLNNFGSREIRINHNELVKLYKLGLRSDIFDLGETFDSLLESENLIWVTKVINEGRSSETFCFTEPIRNLGMFNGVLIGNCLEILQPTKPYNAITDLYTDEKHERGEISLCALGAIVPSFIDTDEEYEDVAYYTLLMIDKCIHKNTYKFPHLEYTAKSRMNAGVGMIGIAYDLAKHNLKYSSKEGLERIHYLAERHSYFIIKASIKLGKEKGNAPWINKTKWPEGWLPIDTYNKNIDEITDFKYNYNWEALREEVIANKGIRNSCLVSYMPTESSSKVTGLPNNVYPVRDIYLKKTDASNAIDFIARDSDTIKDNYQLAWELTPEEQCMFYGVIQKFTDQGISADFYSDRRNNPELKATKLLSEFFNAYKYGLKTRYYTNSKTTKSIKLESFTDERGCSGGSCSL